jgi:hypothetical protein
MARPLLNASVPFSIPAYFQPRNPPLIIRSRPPPLPTIRALPTLKRKSSDSIESLPKIRASDDFIEKMMDREFPDIKEQIIFYSHKNFVILPSGKFFQVRQRSIFKDFRVFLSGYHFREYLTISSPNFQDTFIKNDHIYFKERMINIESHYIYSYFKMLLNEFLYFCNMRINGKLSIVNKNSDVFEIDTINFTLLPISTNI